MRRMSRDRYVSDRIAGAGGQSPIAGATGDKRILHAGFGQTESNRPTSEGQVVGFLRLRLIGFSGATELSLD